MTGWPRITAPLERLISEAPKHLVAGGVLQIVVQRRIKATELVQTAFGNVEMVARERAFPGAAGQAGQIAVS